jgi:hypothetical protein
MPRTAVKDRTSIKHKENGSPVQMDSDALYEGAAKDKTFQKLRKLTAHIGSPRHQRENPRGSNY